jgi:hypothetical protein
MRTKAGRSWNVASSAIAATTAPGNTSRSVRWSFVSTTYADVRKKKMPITDTPRDTV